MHDMVRNVMHAATNRAEYAAVGMMRDVPRDVMHRSGAGDAACEEHHRTRSTIGPMDVSRTQRIRGPLLAETKIQSPGASMSRTASK